MQEVNNTIVRKEEKEGFLEAPSIVSALILKQSVCEI
jgi:hypothetical protein